eukprot:TRINITY_DN80168_c0_g1_i1.p1 TRINITY_DN80168_c0_g1~~TRINITY_DN80168_c0_g1_i1.p1  ORF type:complete len:442 (+),score=85.71 TRINITY_DN80168_c0_g1_i1:92-1417(+)
MPNPANDNQLSSWWGDKASSILNILQGADEEPSELGHGREAARPLSPGLTGTGASTGLGLSSRPNSIGSSNEAPLGSTPPMLDKPLGRPPSIQEMPNDQSPSLPDLPLSKTRLESPRTDEATPESDSVPVLPSPTANMANGGETSSLAQAMTSEISAAPCFADHLSWATSKAPVRLGNRLADDLQQACLSEAANAGATSHVWDVELPKGSRSFMHQVARTFASQVESMGFAQVEWWSGKEYRTAQGRFIIFHDPVYEKYHMKVRVRWLDRPQPVEQLAEEVESPTRRRDHLRVNSRGSNSGGGPPRLEDSLEQIQALLDQQRQLLESYLDLQRERTGSDGEVQVTPELKPSEEPRQLSGYFPPEVTVVPADDTEATLNQPPSPPSPSSPNPFQAQVPKSREVFRVEGPNRSISADPVLDLLEAPANKLLGRDLSPTGSLTL